MNLLDFERGLYIVVGFLFGISLGSFIKVIVDRSLENKKFTGRSYCPNCRHNLRWYDLLPVLSFIFLSGKCRYCKKTIPIEYPIIELSVGILASLLVLQKIPQNFLESGFVSQSLVLSDVTFHVFIILVLVAVLITDIKKGIIPDRITFPATFIALIYLVVNTLYKIGVFYQSVIQNPLGKYLLPPQSDYFLRHVILIVNPLFSGLMTALVIGLFFASLIILTRGRGMGGGDLKLGIFIGLVLGFPNGLIALMIAFFTGSIFGIALLIFGKKKFGQTIPFGPFLSTGGIITILWGEMLLNWYLNLKIY